jgi:hypothetical protein
MENELDSWTASNLFLVPLLGIYRYKLREMGFINSFMYNSEMEEQIEGVIHLLFSPSSTEKFNEFLEIQREEGLTIIQEQDYPPTFSLITCLLPKHLKEDYELFWKGHYSKMSKEYKDLIPHKVRKTDENGKTITSPSLQHLVFQKDVGLRRNWEERLNVLFPDDLDLWSVPDVEKETFKLFKHEKSTTGVA